MADVLRLPFHSLRFSSSLLTSFASSFNSLQPGLPANQNPYRRVYPLSYSSVAPFAFRTRKQLVSIKVQATVAEKDKDQPKWWERSVPNMVDIHSTPEFLSALAQAGDRLVIVEFYGTWCASCRALFPKLCRTAEDHPEILFLKVNFDENKPMCKSMNVKVLPYFHFYRMNVKVLPYFHFYRGSEGQLESFSCSLAKLQKLKDAIALHNTDRCSIGPPKGVGDLIWEPSSAPKDKPLESASS